MRFYQAKLNRKSHLTKLPKHNRIHIQCWFPWQCLLSIKWLKTRAPLEFRSHIAYLLDMVLYNNKSFFINKSKMRWKKSQKLTDNLVMILCHFVHLRKDHHNLKKHSINWNEKPENFQIQTTWCSIITDFKSCKINQLRLLDCLLNRNGFQEKITMVERDDDLEIPLFSLLASDLNRKYIWLLNDLNLGKISVPQNVPMSGDLSELPFLNLFKWISICCYIKRSFFFALIKIPDFQRIEWACIAFFEVKWFDVQLNLLSIGCINHINAILAGWISIGMIRWFLISNE